MILLIDAGNTRLKFAWIAPGAAVRSQPAAHVDWHALDTLPAAVPARPTRILASNVAGSRGAERLQRLCQATWTQRIEWCDTHQGRVHLRNHYQPADHLGADRWMGLLGALTHLRGAAPWQAGSACVLASFGTATTIDTLLPAAPDDVDRRPHFPGGLILPGASLMARSLVAATADLPLAHDQAPADFPCHTNQAIASGIAAAQGGALLRQWQHARRASGGRPPLVFVSGGAWPAVRTEVCAALQAAGSSPPRWLDAPTLDGLATLVQVR